MIRLNNVTKHFGTVRALDRLTLQIPAGKIFGLIGPNGAGKTTTIRILAGLLRPDFGNVEFDGIHGDRYLAIRRMTGALIEQPGLYGKLTMTEYLHFFARLYDLKSKKSRQRIRTVIEMLELGGFEEKRLQGLSLGTKQKVALARILLHDPPVLLLDEPTAGLDPLISKKVRDYFSGEKGGVKTILVSTHNLDEASRFCDEIAIIRQGRILDQGAWKELRGRHASQGMVTIRFLEAEPRFEKIVRNMDGVREIEMDANRKTLSYATDDYTRSNPEVIKELTAAGAPILSVDVDGVTLEQAYMKLIGPGAEAGRHQAL